MQKTWLNPTIYTHAMSAHGRENSEGSNPHDNTILNTQVSSLKTAMASQCERGAPPQSKPQRSEEALSDCTICATEHSLDNQPSSPDTVEDGISKQPKRSLSASAAAYNEREKPIEAPTMAPRDPEMAEFPKLHKLSMLATSTFVLACVTVPCCVAFIGFLWSNPHGNQDNETWFKIVLNGWILKSITISTMVLRVAVSAQAG